MVLYGYRFTHLRQIHTNSRVWLAEKLLEEPALTTCAVAEASQWTDAFAFRLLRCVPPHRWFWNPGMPQLSPSSSTESWKRFPLGGTSSPARKGKWKAWIVSLSHEAALAWYHACVEMWHLWTCGIHYVNDHAWKQIEQNIRLRYCDIKRYQKTLVCISIWIYIHMWKSLVALPPPGRWRWSSACHLDRQHTWKATAWYQPARWGPQTCGQSNAWRRKPQSR